MTDHWYKLLDAEGCACNGGHCKWNLPIRNADGSWTPGEWMPVVHRVELCQSGYHLVDAAHILDWQGQTLWEAEIAPGATKDSADDKIAVSCCRLIRQVETYNDRTLRLLACDFAEHVLPIFESQRPGDDRPRQAIETARQYAGGAATEAELAVAWNAAWAAWHAAGDARNATRAARHATRAAWIAAGNARNAAWDAWIAAGDARNAGAVEREWQIARLCEVLEIAA